MFEQTSSQSEGVKAPRNPSGKKKTERKKKATITSTTAIVTMGNDFLKANSGNLHDGHL